MNAVATAIALGSEVPPPTDLTRTIRIEREGAVQRLLPRVVPVAAFDTRRQGAILLLYDVTELARLDEMRSEVVAVASHELQTPLTTLRMTLLMLQEAADLLPDRQRQLVATSLIGVEQLTETVHEFLDLTRIEAGELRLNLDSINLSAVLAKAVARVEGQAVAQGVSLSNHVEAGLPPVVADPLRLRAVFDNILSNALKYTPSGGSVSIEAQCVSAAGGDSLEGVSISINDTGPGIPPAFRSRLFDKFFRIEHQHSESRPMSRGAGIGLYMCKQIVELHGGQISCTSGAGERGTRVTVTLPAALSAESTAANATAFADPSEDTVAHRRLVVTLAVLAILGAVGYVAAQPFAERSEANRDCCRIPFLRHLSVTLGELQHNRVYAGQIGQDKWVIETMFPDVTDGFFVDVRSSHGTIGSNSVALERKGWTGICIDPFPV